MTLYFAVAGGLLALVFGALGVPPALRQLLADCGTLVTPRVPDGDFHRRAPEPGEPGESLVQMKGAEGIRGLGSELQLKAERCETFGQSGWDQVRRPFRR